MSTLLALDPGLRKAGAALFKAGVLTQAVLIRNRIEGRGAKAWLGIVSEIKRTAADYPDEVAAEVMQIDGRGVPPGDLLELNGVSGAVLGWVGQGCSYTPKQWKGSVPKTVHHKRAVAELSKDELTRIPRALRSQPDVLDAVALGLFHLGRLK